MTPKEKAEELWSRFDEIISLNSWADEKTNIEEFVLLPKMCALIAVDEMIEIAEQYENALSISQTSDYPEFLKQLKQEIEKL